MFTGQSNFLQALGWALLNSLWQMALIWVLSQLILGLFKKSSASQKSLLASGSIIIGFLWFVFTFVSILNSNTSGNEMIAYSFTAINGSQRLNNWLTTTLPIVSLAYIVLLILQIFYFIRNYRYVQTIRRYEISKADIDWRMFVRNVAERMGIKKPVRLFLSGIVTSPVTIGYIKPVILLPIAAINQLSTQQLEAVLLHELAHIRRYDYLVNLIIRFIHSILYFNPFVKALMKMVEREREKSCDEIVMQFQYDPHGYASALLLLEKVNYLRKPLAVAVSGRKHDLLHRIECMLGVEKKKVFSFNRLAGVLAALLCFIAINSLLLLSKPGEGSNHGFSASSSIADVTSPMYFFNESGRDESKQLFQDATELAQKNTILNHIEKTVPAIQPDESITQPDEGTPVMTKETVAASPFAFANLTQTVAIELKKYQEAQVKEAVEASKKILEEKQWKDVEKGIADAMTESEKAMLKSEYERELSKVDWNKMQDKLRLAYDQIDWPNVNENLNKAITEIKLDSLKQVYSVAVSELSTLQKELCENNLKGVPDTDISLKEVEQSKKNVQVLLNKLNKVKVKKIVSL